MSFVVLAAFLVSLMLQSLGRPGETPRAEIERLTGIDIAASLAVSECPDEGDMTMVMPQMPHAPKAGHHHDAACALCPLLQLGFFILSSCLLAAFSHRVLLGQCVILPPGRAPPGLRWLHPPAQAPPLS
ncbi:hypothetical protein [Asaia astilbis]